ncbi:MAG: hypothetical protein M5R36_25530 [Deltaproteobacteria bacterium]|nr:hypothetical protein [Deltaproteobacteria bacterium]
MPAPAPSLPAPPPAPVPHTPAPPRPELPGEVKEEAVGFLYKIVAFFKYDFFPNLWMYLTLVFIIVISVVIFAGINIVVRSITDPIMHKVFRFGEDSRIPPLLGGLASVIVTILVLQWFYNSFPALRPPVEFVTSRF